ncbi:MAG: glycosyltransferase family 1 protein [Patescibacteria group bacterium]
MKIAINTLPLSTEHRMRGTGVYTKNLIEALATYEKKHSYFFFIRVQDIPERTDVVHYPFFDPFFLTLPFIKRFPTVVTVHDLIPLVFPDKFPPGLRGKLKWQIQRLSLLGSSGVITDSQCSKDDIVRITGRKQSGIHVVPLAQSQQYRRITGDAVLKQVRQRYHLPDEYVLYIGDVNWNKNVIGLINAWKVVLAKNVKSRSCKLVLAGSAFTDAEVRETREILHLIDSFGMSKHVIRPGFIKDEDMAGVYSASSCVVLPSWYEGFGFPILEAMACGVPVVATNRGSVPEISGPARVVDPADTNVIAKTILEMLQLSELERRELIRKGFEWIKYFSWKRVASETVAVYEHIAARTT